MPSISRSSGLSSRAAISSWFWTPVSPWRLPSRLLRACRARAYLSPGDGDRACGARHGWHGPRGSAIAARLEAEGFAVLAAGTRATATCAARRGARARRARRRPSSAGSTFSSTPPSNGFEPRPVEEVTEADWDAALGSTAKGSFFVTQAAVPHLRASSLGLVVMIEDVAAYRPWPSFAPHCAAKAAQAMLTRVFARALAPEIRVCGIAPGPVAVEPEQEERRAAETLARPRRLPGGRRGRGCLPRRRGLRHRLDALRRRRPLRLNSAVARPGTGPTADRRRWRLVSRHGIVDAFRARSPADDAVTTRPTVDPSDAALIQRVARGDRDAFEQLYKRLRAPGARAGAAPARRQRPRRGRRAGDLRRGLALGAELQGRARHRLGLALRRRAPRDHRPRAAEARNAVEAPDEADDEPAPPSAPRSPGSRGACTARSSSCRSASASCSSSPTGAGSRRRRSPATSTSRSERSRRARAPALARLAGAARGGKRCERHAGLPRSRRRRPHA